MDKEKQTSITDTVLHSEVMIHGKLPKKASLKFTPDENSYVIDEDYVFVLTHPDLEDEAKIPFVCGLVTDKDWLRA